MKIVLIEPIGIETSKLDEISALFSENGHEFIYYPTRETDEDILIERGSDAEVIILGNMPFSGRVIQACRKLKMISVAFTGVDHIDMKICTQKNILVSNAAGYSDHAVAELTFGLAIQLLRNLNWAEQQTREYKDRDGFLGRELYNKTFGIIGTGKIGQNVAKLANAFGCRVLAYNRSRKPIQYIEYTTLEDVLAKSDIVSLHIPLKKETEGLINEDMLDLMKPSSILINTARGQIIDSKALSKALKENKIAGAALDVYETEPPLNPNHPLFEAPNVLMVPHIGYATKEAIELRGEIVMDNVLKWIEGKPQNVMNFQ